MLKTLGLAVITSLFFAGFIADARVVKNHKWYNISAPEEFESDFSVFPQGRVAYFSKSGDKASIQTALVENDGQTRWITVAKENQGGLSGKLTGRHQRLECTGDACFFLSANLNNNLTLWTTSGLANGLSNLSRILYANQETNLGRVTSLKTFMIDMMTGNRVYVYAEVGSHGAGLYEIGTNGFLSLVVPQPGTQTFDWDAQKMHILNKAFVFVGWTKGDAQDRFVNRRGLFRINLDRPNQAQEVVREHKLLEDGASITSCCSVSINPSGFLVWSLVYDGSGPQSKANLTFVDTLGKVRQIARERLYFTPDGTMYGARLLEPFSWSDFLFVRGSEVNGTQKESLFSLKPATGEETLVAETGDLIHSTGPVNWITGFTAGGTTTNNKKIIATYNFSTVPIVQFSLGIKPEIRSLTPAVVRPNDDVTVTGANLLINGMRAKVKIGEFETEVSGSADKISFRVPASVPSGKHEVKLELQDQTGTISVSTGTVEVVNSYPLPTVSSLTSGANFEPLAVSPCAIATIFGANLTNLGNIAATTLPLPRELGGSQLLVNGQPTPLFFVSPGQINFQMPCELDTAREKLLEVLTTTPNGIKLNSSRSKFVPRVVSPATFRYQGLAIITDLQGVVKTQTNPLEVGQYFIIYATGLGAVSPAVKSGEAAPAEPLARTIANTTVKIGGVEAEVLYSGLAPGFVGLYQINTLVPEGTTAGEQWLEVIAGGSRDISKIPVK